MCAFVSCVGSGLVTSASTPTNGTNPSDPIAVGPKGGGNTNDANSNANLGPRPTSRDGDGNYTIGPSYAVDANMNAGSTKAARRSCQFVLSGDKSAYYTGTDPLLSESYAPIRRNVYVSIPNAMAATTRAPFLILHDAQYTRGYIANVLDNLAAKQAIPEMVSIALDNGGGDSFGSERGLEYDVVSDKYAQFVQNEVLPAVEANCNIKLSQDAGARAVLGLSSGGAAAIGMGYWHPEWFGRIITYSATVVAQFQTKEYPDGAWAYPTKLFADSAEKNLRIFLCAGQNDLQAGQNDTHDFLLANRKAADTLASKGYHYQFYYALGASHTDDRVVRQTLPAALTWAWRGYVAP